MHSTTSDAVGSIDRLYELLQQAAVTTPVVGNEQGSYLTMKSNQGLVFGAATILSGFSGVFCDQGQSLQVYFWLLRGSEEVVALVTGYWQRV